MTPEMISIIVAIVIGVVAVVIPLIVALIKFIIKAVKEKNWKPMVSLVMNLIKEAETKFGTGAEKKEWVMGMVKATAKSIGYNLKEEELSNMIDNIVALTKQVNMK